MARIEPSPVIEGVLIVTPQSHGDERGRFVETFRQEWLPPNAKAMIQGNRSDKQAGAVVGLHYHRRQADYWYVVRGTARVVLHDLRQGSPTEGNTLAVDIGDDNEQGVYIPAGVAHGFASLTDLTMTYLVDQYYSPDDELGVQWDDAAVAADWGVTGPVLSARDRANPAIADLPQSQRPVYNGI